MSIISTQYTQGQTRRVLSAVPGSSTGQNELRHHKLADGPNDWADTVLLVHRVKTAIFKSKVNSTRYVIIQGD